MRSLAAVSVGWLGISMVADGLTTLLVPHQVAASGGNAGRLGVLLLVALALAALAQPIAGAMSDRVGRPPVIIAGLAIALSGLAVIVAGGALAAGTILGLVGVAVTQAGYQALLPDRIGVVMRGRAAGAKGVFDVGGAFLGFALLGGLLAVGNVFAAGLVLAAGLAGSILIALAVLPRARTNSGPARRGLAQPPATSAPLASLIIARFLFLLGIYAVGRFLLLFIGDRLGLSADAAAAHAAGALVLLTLLTAGASLPAGWLTDRLGRQPTMLAGGVVAAVGIAVLPLATSLVAIVVFGSLMAVGTAAFSAANWAALADATAGIRTGRLLGIANFGTAGAAAAAGVFGPVIDAGDALRPGAGYASAFLLAGMVTAAGGVAGWRANDRRSSPALRTIEVPD